MRYQLTVLALASILLIGCGAPQDRADSALADQSDVYPATAIQTTDDHAPDDHLVYRPGEIVWQPGPASLAEGAQYAVLEGDPGEADFFTMRLRMPDGFEIAPHWHPNVERVSVVSGTFLLGSGETIDRGSADRLEPGSYFSMPEGMRHYAIAEGETVIQLTSIGPWEINYVNEADDPRTR